MPEWRGGLFPRGPLALLTFASGLLASGMFRRWLQRGLQHGWQPCLLAVAALLAFSPAFPGGWLWDDNLEVFQNPALHDAHGLAAIWLHPASPDPLKQTVEWLGWGLWGDSPLGFRLLGFACHLASAFLVWRLLAVLGLERGWAWLGALLFAVHPLAVESVAWIAELKNTISLPFFLASLLAYAAYARGGARRDYLLSLALFAAALLCKASTAMGPAVLLLYLWWRNGRIARRDLAGLLPFAVLAAGMALVSMRLQGDVIGLAPGATVVGGPLSRIACAGLAFAFYLLKFVLPVGLMPIYPRWQVDPPALLQFAPWAVLAVLCAWFWRRRAGWGRHAILALGFFVLNLLPVAGLVPLAYFRLSWVADHFAYIALVGLAGGAAALAGAACPRAALPRRLFLAGIGAAVLALVLGSAIHSSRFTSQEALWTYNVAANPSAWMARNNLGVALAQRGRLSDAAGQYEEALRLNPECEEAHNNLGVALAREGRFGEAAAHFEAALAINPHYPSPRKNLERLRALRPGP